MRRRDFLKSAAILAGAPLSIPVLLERVLAQPRPSEIRQPFDYAWLKGHARSLACNAYRAQKSILPKSLAALDYDDYQAIRFRPDKALWADRDLDFQVQFFHPGPMFTESVRMHEVVDGEAREIAYHQAMFNFRKAGMNGGALPKDLGFAGFRVQFHTDWKADIAAFLGASYFRAVGSDHRQYGLSARGLAIDTGLEKGEEFPRFASFWFERPAKHSSRLSVYALMDSPSATGAYRFDIMPGATLTMDVDAAVYPRKTIERLGIAPLTSMYQHGENDRRMANDWRPEIHDSDGLSLLTGKGEWIWRPLVNPDGVRVNSYFDGNPRGFGLLQRDRNFDHYQDDGVYYERRPSLWVEPKVGANSGWGRGAVQLVELPAPDETYDNIVAYWSPADTAQPGQELLFSYRLHWGSKIPYSPTLAQVVSTRTGIGGIVGQKRQYFSWRFAVDFAGGELATLAKNVNVEPVISASRGGIEIASARPQAEINGYRAMFDIKPTDESLEPIDLRLYLRVGAQPLTETWIYQWTPPPVAERKY
ncbi:MAG: glucan biosynthesis protein D [Deltaproteobacteria bacterium]|nr:glucan biosynthesis protein D [Deltaproteobacteria bacterium]